MEINNIRVDKIRNIIILSIIILVLLSIVIIVCLRHFKTSNTSVPVAETLEDNIENEIKEEPEEIIEIEEPTVVEEELEKTATTEIKANQIDKKNIQNNTSTTNNINTMAYYIKVNCDAQVVTIYGKDSKGNYTVPVKAMICSTGVATPTSGVYLIPGRWRWGALFGGVYGQYVTKITGNILFHSVPYLRSGDASSLEYWEYDKLGIKASAGCVRLTVSDAKWIYDNCRNGTKVEFYSSSNPGPLGKPSVKKISSYPDYLRNWDPTDSNSNNPWNSYQEGTKQEEPKKDFVPQPTPKPEVTPTPSPTPEVDSEPVPDKKEDSESKQNSTSEAIPNHNSNHNSNQNIESEQTEE